MALDRYPYTVPAIILSAGFLLSTIVAGSFASSIKASDQTISVTGSAQQIITSDRAKWSVMLTDSTDKATLKEGSERMGKSLASLKAYLKKNAVDEKFISVMPMTVENLTSMYDQGSQLVGYRLTQIVQIESDDVKKLTQIAQGSSSLLAGGSAVSTMSLEYYYSKLSDLKVDMLAVATENAKLRAEKIAGSAGSRLGALKGASMGVMQVTAVNSVDVSDYGTYDTSALEKQITAIVRATFAVR